MGQEVPGDAGEEVPGSGPGNPTRRMLLGAAAAAAAGAVAACSGAGSATGGAGSGHASTSRRVLRSGTAAENALPGERDWWIRRAGAPDAIIGFTGQASVLAGEPVTLYVSTTAREFRVSALRMGWYGGLLARQVWQSAWVPGRRQRRPALIQPTRTVSCDWGPSLTIPTHGWPDGTYLLRLDAQVGGHRYVPMTVRSASTAGKVVIKNSVETWQAYNTWGGYDLYTGPGGYPDRSLAVSLDRPYDGNGAEQFHVFERKVINLAERLGLPLAYVTSMDIHREAGLLDRASALISLGHDEYWTPAERGHVTGARNSGANVAFLGANAMFRRTRLAPTMLGEDRLVICYKTDYTRDPMYGKHNDLVTSDWREPPNPDPESSLTGTLYESNPTTADYVVVSPRAWMFAGTGVRKGTRFPGLVGDEYDRVNPGDPVMRPIQILSHSPLTCRGVRSYSDSAYYTHKGGAGVVNTGTMRWVQSMARPYGHYTSARTGAFTSKVTASILRAFAHGPVAAQLPAHDNLAAMHEWPGDPMAAGHDLWPPIVT